MLMNSLRPSLAPCRSRKLLLDACEELRGGGCDQGDGQVGLRGREGMGGWAAERLNTLDLFLLHLRFDFVRYACILLSPLR